MSHLIVAILQDDVIANFRFQRLGSSWQKVNQSLPSKPKAQNLTKQDLWSCKSLAQDTGVVHQFTETGIFLATTMKKHIKKLILPAGCLFVNLLTEKLRI